MTSITIELQDDIAQRLEAEAQRLNVSTSQLACFGVIELVERPDDEIEEIAQRVIADNEELLRRLA